MKSRLRSLRNKNPILSDISFSFVVADDRVLIEGAVISLSDKSVNISHTFTNQSGKCKSKGFHPCIFAPITDVNKPKTIVRYV